MAAQPMLYASSTRAYGTCSYWLGKVRSSLWLILRMNGILWAYFRATDPSTPYVVATALQPPSMASSTMLAGSKYAGFLANDAPAECSMPWSTGRIER